ncbi:hypothetical protein EVAR_101523_1 [Eumeta japonica]|uniref:Uncharacterized protein n=1 Tax=Eumeta variegata TaxID=151549 RepID=A0A4C1SCP9_EUMVA|nr:hypothetical protein EVAR_101523_1 [Eumeta japonica]
MGWDGWDKHGRSMAVHKWADSSHPLPLTRRRARQTAIDQFRQVIEDPSLQKSSSRSSNIRQGIKEDVTQSPSPPPRC